jgi:alpha-beta hydrolase superfamily lysophospholipase
MRHATTWLDVAEAEPLCLHSWLPSGSPRAVLLLVHGMAEHALRYARFAEALCQHGIAVYAHDQRGHGQTGQQALLGHYADREGWNLVIADVRTVQEEIQSRHHDTPLFLFGHSMGSYIAQGFLIRYGQGVRGAILCGSNYQPARLYRAARAFVRLEYLHQGPRGRSRLFNWMTFGAFNRAFEPSRTGFDWLTRDAKEVDRYIADPLCGSLCTNQLWIDLLGGLIEISAPSNLARIDPALPVLIVGGDRDPVSAGHRLKALLRAYLDAGIRNTRLELYAEARHELLNETIRKAVTADLISWIEQQLVTEPLDDVARSCAL